MQVFSLFRTILDSSGFLQLQGWSEAEKIFRQSKNLLSNLVTRVPSFYIRIKSRLKTRVTTVHLLQCKTKFFICLNFWGRNLRKLKNIHLGKPELMTKKFFFWSVYTTPHSSTLFCIRLDSSSDSSKLVYIRLMTPLLLSTFVCTRLDSSSDSSVFLEQIGSKCMSLEQERFFFSNEDKIITQNDYEEKRWSAYKNLEKPSFKKMGKIQRNWFNG